MTKIDHFCLEKTIKFSCTYYLLSFCKILKLFLELIQSYKDVPFVLNNFFWYKPLLLLSSTCWLFSLCKIYKIFLQRIQRYEDRSFLGPKWSICSKQFFFENYSYHFHLTISPFQCAKFQKNFPADPVLWGCAIFGPKIAHLPKWEIFQKTC